MHASVCDGRYPRAKACYLLYKGIPSLALHLYQRASHPFFHFLPLSLSFNLLFLLLLTPLYRFTACLPSPFFYYSSLFHSSLSPFFTSVFIPHSVPNNNLVSKKKNSERVWGNVRQETPPLKTSVLPLNSLTPHTRPTHTHTHTHPPGGLIQAFISPNRGKDNHSTPMRSPRYHPCECVWMHFCVCLPLEPQSATQRTQEKT